MVRFLLVFGILVLSSASVFADDTASSWEADKARLEQLHDLGLPDEQRCQETWDILWPWAKKRNLEARRLLTMLLLPPPHGDSITMPTGKEDYLKDGVIMAVNSLNNEVSKEKSADVAFSLDEFFTSQSLVYLSDDMLKEAFPDKPARYFKDEQLLRCIAYKAVFDERIEDCISSTVKAGLFPTFEDYANGIDEAITRGKRAECHFN